MKYLKIFADFEDCMKELGDAERGRLFTAMLRYARKGELMDLPGNERFLWSTAQQHLDRMVEQYNKVCAANSSNARKRCDKPKVPASEETSFDLEEIRQFIEENSGG